MSPITRSAPPAPCRRARPSFRFLAPLALAAASWAHAATPPSGTISNANPSTSWTGSIAGAITEVGELGCVDGVSCDSFQVILAPGDYTGKQVKVQVSWTVPAYDYDLYVHRNTLRGPVYPAANGGPPTTEEHVLLALDSFVVTTPIVWWAHVQAATVPPGQTYHGTASIVDLPNAPQITHVAGTLTFSHSVPLFARGTVRDEEPSVRVDVQGNCYVGAIRGVPAGVDMWRFDLNPLSPTFDPEMRRGAYLGQPDAFQQMGAEDSTAGGADGGGDIEIATSFPTDGSQPVLTMVSLALADISSSVSTDRGVTWQHDAAAASAPSDDRQWIEADGPNDVYLVYRGLDPSTTLFCQRSTDHGMTYGPATPIVNTVDPGDLSTPGYIDIDHVNHIVYVAHQGSGLYVSRSTDQGLTWTTVLVDDQTDHGHLFDVVKVGDDGTVYAVWSNERHILYSYSTDHGATWTPASILDDPGATLTNVFPWVEAGSAGRLGVVWYGTTGQNISAADWDVYYSLSLDANSATPTFAQQRVTDHPIHGSNISEGGLGGSDNRNLGDYFQVAYDPQGAAVIAFDDDHNDFDGNTYVVRQLDGPGLLASANGGTGIVEAVASTVPPLYPRLEPEVIDPVHDAIVQTQPLPADNPFDIVSIDYFTDTNGPNAPYLGARMTLSGLTSAVDGNWRIAFTANAPFADDLVPDAMSDHGDMFYIMASDTSGVPTFTYGTGYRDSMPLVPVLGAYAMAYNYAGAADGGSIDTTTSTVTVKVALSKINALIPAGHAPIGQGSWLAGLRGSATSSGAGPRDNTRGGLDNFFVNFDPNVAVDPVGGLVDLALVTSPNPARGPASLRFAMPSEGRATLGIYDLQGRLVRMVTAGTLPAGSHLAAWDGTTAAGAPARGGVYFAKLSTAGRDVVSRFVLLR